MSTRTENLQIRITVDGDGQVKASLAGVQQSLGQIKPKAEEGAGGIGKITDAVKELAAGFTLVEGARWLVESIANAQVLETRLRAVADSQEEVNGAQTIAKTIAAESANSADQVTQAYITLRQRGLAPSMDSMRSFANIAAGTGKSIDEVASAIGSALTGQVRGLQELGIHVEEENGRLVATFRGVKEDIGSTANDIVGYLIRMGETRYSGAAQEEASTLIGSWAHLKQAAGDLADGIGSSGLTEILTKIVQGMTAVVKEADAMAHRADTLSGVFQTMAYLTPGIGTAMQARWMANGMRGGSGGAAGANGQPQADFSNVSSMEGALTMGLGHEAESASRAALADDKLTSAHNNLAQSTQGVIEQLQKQLVALTQGEAASIRHSAAEAAGKADTKAHADEILRLGNQIADLIEKRKADQDALKESIALQDAYNESVQRTHALIDDEVKREKQLADAYKAVLDVIDPNGREVRQLSEDYATLAAAQAKSREAGELTTKQIKEQNAALAELGKRLDEASAKRNLADWFGKITGDKESAAAELDNVMNEVAATFTKALKSGFKDVGKDAADMLGGIADQIVNDIIRKKIFGNIANAAGGGQLNSQQLGEGASTAVGVYGGTAIGGGGDYANAGADVGSVVGGIVGAYFGPVGSMIGSMLGGLIGGAIGGLFEKDGTAKVYSGPDSNSSEGGIDAFGRVQAYTNGLGDGAEKQLLQALMALDNTMARLLTRDEIDKVKGALVGHVSEAATADEALADRLNVIIRAVEPQWVDFLSKFTDVQSKGAAFASLRSIDKELENFGDILTSVSGTPLQQFMLQMKQLDDKVTETATALASAIASQDPTQIEQSSAAAIKAVVDRYNAEIQLAQNLEQAIHAAQQAAYQLNLTIAQRIAGITGSNANVQSLALGRVADLQGAIPGENPAQGLGDLNDYIGAVDTWLASATGDINNWLNTALQGLQQQQAAAQAAAQARQAALQREVQIAQQQLALAQQWVNVLNHAKSLIESMRFGESNPLGAFGQLDALNSTIQQMLHYTSATGAQGQSLDISSDEANHLLDLLQQRLQLVQSQGLFQRPSGDYTDQYNQTLALIQQVEALAQPGVDRAELLQQRIADLQAQTVAAVDSGSASIAAQEAALRAEARERLDRLNAQALGYYTWAQDQAQTLEDARAQDLLDQLNELTHGLPVQDFIALKQNEATELLTDIRDNLRSFLDAISNGAASGSNAGGGDNSNGSTGNTGGTGGGGGGGAGNINPTAFTPGGDVHLNVTINASGLGEAEAGALVRKELKAAASDIKRALKVA